MEDNSVLNIIRTGSRLKRTTVKKLSNVSRVLILGGMLSIGARTAFAKTNDGDIVINSTTGEILNGLEADADDPIGINNGTITVTGAGQLYGMIASPTLIGGAPIAPPFTLSNNGTINVTSIGTSVIAYGMQASGPASHNLTNSGIINVTVTGTDPGINSPAYGMQASGFSAHTLTNSGIINVTATGTTVDAIGMHASANHPTPGNVSTNHTLSNSGTMNIIATGPAADTTVGTAVGMWTDALGSHTFTNSGTINVTAAAGKISAYGMYANATGSHTLTNSGTLNVTSIISAIGMEAHFSPGTATITSAYHKLSNSGTINVTVTSTDAANAYGMYAQGTGSHALFSNSGTINAIATGENSTAGINLVGMYALGDGNHTLSNSGTINLTATGTNKAFLYGMQIADGTATVNNTGIINLHGSVAGTDSRLFEAYGNVSYSVGTWATTLRNFSATDNVFGVTNTATVTFNNSHLILRPGDVADGFALGKAYDVKNMVSQDGATAGLGHGHAGNIGSVSTETELLIATLTGTTSADQKVSLNGNVTEKNNPGSSLAVNGVQSMHSRMGNMSSHLKKIFLNKSKRNKTNTNNDLIAKTNSTVVNLDDSQKYDFFFATHVHSANNTNLDFDFLGSGIAAGLNYNINEELSLGMHFDISSSNLDSGKELSGDTFSYALGVHSNYFINKNWYIYGQLTGSFDVNEINYNMLNSIATDEYNSYSLYTAFNTGYVWKINENNNIVPEIGLSYLYTSSSDIEFNFTGTTSLYDMKIDENSYNALYANATLNWEGDFIIGNSHFRPSLGFGVRQNLTGNEINSNLHFVGQNFETQTSEDSTSALINAAAEWTLNQSTFALIYSGVYGEDQVNHSGKFIFNYMF